MTTEQLYEQHKGKKAVNRSFEGIVCGYDDVNLIMAVTSDMMGLDKDSPHLKEACIEEDYMDNPNGFMFILPEMIIN